MIANNEDMLSFLQRVGAQPAAISLFPLSQMKMSMDSSHPALHQPYIIV
jgi:hypothetical protein